MDDRAVDRFVRSALEAERPDAGPHPEPDVLFSYHALELSDEDLERVQAHLSLCPRCARAVADLEAFPALDPPSDDDLPSDADLAAGWADVQRRLAAGEGAADVSEGAPAPVAERARKVVLPFTPPTPTRVRPALQGVRAAAAVLAVTTLGAAFLAFNARQEVKEARAIQPDPFDIMLDDADALIDDPNEAPANLRGGGAAPRPPDTVPQGRAVIVVHVPRPPDTGEQQAYPAELWREGAAKPDWAGVLRQANKDLPLAFTATRASLPAGKYRIRIFANRSAKPSTDYAFEIAYDP